MAFKQRADTGSTMRGGGKPRPVQKRTAPGGKQKQVAPTQRQAGPPQPPQQPMQPMQGADIAQAILRRQGSGY